MWCGRNSFSPFMDLRNWETVSAGWAHDAGDVDWERWGRSGGGRQRAARTFMAGSGSGSEGWCAAADSVVSVGAGAVRRAWSWVNEGQRAG